jgi:hypothetical protein
MSAPLLMGSSALMPLTRGLGTCSWSSASSLTREAAWSGCRTEGAGAAVPRCGGWCREAGTS